MFAVIKIGCIFVSANNNLKNKQNEIRNNKNAKS